MSIFRNIPHWRSARYSPSENRLIFDAETGDASRRHEVAIDESEKHESHEKVRDQMNKFRAANKEFQEKAKASLDLAVKTHEGVLNQKLNAQMGLFMSTEQFTKADPDKKQDLIKTRSASLARDMAARFNQRSLGQDLLATVIVDADGVSNIKLELKPQTPVEQKTDKPADASKDAGAEKKTDEKKPDGKKEEPPKPKEGEAKGAPDQKLLDDTRAKLLPNTKRALETLTVQDQTVALRALAAMPKDQAKIEQFLADPVNAAQVKTILGNAGMIAGMSVDALLPMVRGKNKPTPQDQENAALLKRFATTIMHAKQGPITSPESISDRPEPKTEEERLNRAIDDGLAALKDPNLSGTQKLAAGLAALGAFMQLIKLSISSPELLKAAPQVTTNKETKPSPAGKPGETLPGDSKEAQADKPSRVALEKKAHDKGMNLSQYYMVRKDEQSTEKAHTEELTGKVASAEAQEKTWNARVTELEARNKQKGKDKTPENDAELAEAKGQLAKAKETASQLREQLKDAKEALKAVTADVEAMEALGRELSAMQDRAKDILKTAKQFLSDANGKPIAGAEDILGVLEAGLGGLVISEETLNINITLNDAQMTILRNTCRKYGFTGKNEELGMDASSNVKDINVFVKMLDQLTDKILNNAGALKESKPKPTEKPKDAEKKPSEESDNKKPSEDAAKKPEEPTKKPEEKQEEKKEDKNEKPSEKMDGKQALEKHADDVAKKHGVYRIDFSHINNSSISLNAAGERLGKLDEALASLDAQTKSELNNKTIFLEMLVGSVYAGAVTQERGYITITSNTRDIGLAIKDNIKMANAAMKAQGVSESFGLQDFVINMDAHEADKIVQTLDTLNTVLKEMSAEYINQMKNMKIKIYREKMVDNRDGKQVNVIAGEDAKTMKESMISALEKSKPLDQQGVPKNVAEGVDQLERALRTIMDGADINAQVQKINAYLDKCFASDPGMAKLILRQFAGHVNSGVTFPIDNADKQHYSFYIDGNHVVLRRVERGLGSPEVRDTRQARGIALLKENGYLPVKNTAQYGPEFSYQNPKSPIHFTFENGIWRFGTKDSSTILDGKEGTMPDIFGNNPQAERFFNQMVDINHDGVIYDIPQMQEKARAATDAAEKECNARGNEYLKAIGYVPYGNGSYMQPSEASPFQNYPIVSFSSKEGWKVFMSSSVGGTLDPRALTPENALAKYPSMNESRVALMKQFIGLNRQYQAKLEQAMNQKPIIKPEQRI